MQNQRMSEFWQGARHLLMAGVAILVVGVSQPFETRIFPVVGQMTILDYEDAGGGWTRLHVTAPKYRSCPRWRKIEFSLGSRHEPGPTVKAYFTDQPQVRGEGDHEWRGLMVRLPIETIRQNSFADVFHACLPIDREWAWTRSRFWTGDE